MPNPVLSDLLCTHDHADPGDEVFRRFRFQASYAAMLAIGLLEESNEADEVYCEQFEDILLRLVSGKFRGIQVKTRADGGQSFRATDDPILDSLVRFVELELCFPRAFDGYTLASNVPFDRSGRGHGNLPSVVAEVRAAVNPIADCPKALRLAKTVVARIKKKMVASRKAGAKKATEEAVLETHVAVPVAIAARTSTTAATEADVLGVLAKLDVQDDLPRLPDLGSRMLQRLVQVSRKVAGSTLPAVSAVVQTLQYGAYLAASRGDEDLNGRRWFVSDPIARAQQLLADEVRAKCLSRATVEEAIDKHCTGPLLVSATPVTPDQIPADLGVMEKKLVAGGLSITTIDVARDAVASVEEFGLRMAYIHDAVEGMRRYNHARAIVKKECALSYETQVSKGNLTGPKMLADVEQRLRSRREFDATGVLRECEEEHLLGHAFALTGECIVWWSTLRDLGASSPESVKEGGADD